MNDIGALHKHFSKLKGLPITVYDNPYFMERLGICDRISSDFIVEDYFSFVHDIDRLFSFNEEQYFAHYNEVKENAINYIKSRHGFNTLNSAIDMKNVEMFYSIAHRKRDLYKEENDGQTFISIDMRQANYNTLNHLFPDIFDGFNSWEGFISRYTGVDLIINSKYVRQVILGACNPKRQISCEHFLMKMLYRHLLAQNLNLDIYSLGEDEILIKTDDINFFENELEQILASAPDNLGGIVRAEYFELRKIKGTDGWMKFIYDDGELSDRPKFKCLDAEIYHQVVKYYFGLPIEEDDLVFYHNNKLARFLEPIANPFI